jgi:hypothetical protein
LAAMAPMAPMSGGGQDYGVPQERRGAFRGPRRADDSRSR